MTPQKLMSDLTQLGIGLEARGDQLRYSPRSAMPPDLAGRMNAIKGALLAMLRPNPPAEESADQLLDDLAHRGCILGLDEAGRLVMHGVPPELANDVAHQKAELTRILNIETASMAETMDKIIDPPDPCPKCRALELWESMTGDQFGLTRRGWRCLRCDPPSQARRLRERADRLQRTSRRNPNDER